MSAIFEGKQRVFNILNETNSTTPIYYEEGIGHGYSVIGRIRKTSNERTIIDLLLLDYSDNYESKRNTFIFGYDRFILAQPVKVFTPDPMYY